MINHAANQKEAFPLASLLSAIMVQNLSKLDIQGQLLAEPAGNHSLGFFRWRRLISPCKEVTINCPVLSPSSFTDSNVSTISWGIRTEIFCDLLLMVPVDMTDIPKVWCPSVYIRLSQKKLLKCPSLRYKVSVTSCLHITGNSEASECCNTTEASHREPLIKVTIMAETQSTQTRPKYQYRFMALSRADKAAKPCRLSVEAFNEEEARHILAPHYILAFAARLPVLEVRHDA